MVSVSPKFRRKGIARRMYAMLVDKLSISKDDIISHILTKDGRLLRSAIDS